MLVPVEGVGASHAGGATFVDCECARCASANARRLARAKREADAKERWDRAVELWRAKGMAPPWEREGL